MLNFHVAWRRASFPLKSRNNTLVLNSALVLRQWTQSSLFTKTGWFSISSFVKIGVELSGRLVASPVPFT